MTIRYYFILLIFFIVLPGSYSSIYAQESSSNYDGRYCWADVGIGGAWVNGGIGSPADKSGFSIGLDLYYQNGYDLFSLRITGTVEPRLILWGNQKAESISEYGVLYGRVAKASYGAASVSAGISIVSESPYTSFTTVGFPLEAQLIWTPTSVFGIGFKGFANLNPQKSFAGLLFCLQFGMLR
jgi:hypothetical protein